MRPDFTARDPLEDTQPDPVVRPRMAPGKRRAIEAISLAVLLPGLLATRWVDNSHIYRKQGESVTTVSRTATVRLAHSQWRLLGRQAAKDLNGNVVLLMTARPLDAQGVKDLSGGYGLGFRLRDKAGHVWDVASNLDDSDNKPAVGTDLPVKVVGRVPDSLVSAVVLELRQSSWSHPSQSRWYRFAH